MGREHFTTFQNTLHVLSTLQEKEERAPQLLRPHDVPRFNTDFSGCYSCCKSHL